MAEIKTYARRRRPSRQSIPPERETSTQDTLLATQQSTVLTGVDKVLFYLTLLLCALGLVAVYSASATEALDTYHNSLYFALRQAVFMAVGIGLMLGVSRIPFFAWSRFAQPFALVVLGLLFYTLHSGVEAYGAERWIRIAGIQFQPSELAKLSVLLLLAQAFGHRIKNTFSLVTLTNLALIVVTLLLVYKQPSLSMTIILSSVSLSLMFISGIPMLLLGNITVLGGAYIVYKLMHTEYQMRRIQGWLNPWKDAQDTGYNLIQSLYAIGAGGIFGTGLGMSHQKLFYLPFEYTDFIFSVWAEEWGLVGCIILIGLFTAVLYRGYIIAKTCRSGFGQLLAMGITLIMGFQIIINLSVATGLFPVTGVTLPLISYGGTSVLVTLLMIGILLNISRYRVTTQSIAQPYRV